MMNLLLNDCFCSLGKVTFQLLFHDYEALIFLPKFFKVSIFVNNLSPNCNKLDLEPTNANLLIILKLKKDIVVAVLLYKDTCACEDVPHYFKVQNELKSLFFQNLLCLFQLFVFILIKVSLFTNNNHIPLLKD